VAITLKEEFEIAHQYPTVPVKKTANDQLLSDICNILERKYTLHFDIQNLCHLYFINN